MLHMLNNSSKIILKKVLRTLILNVKLKRANQTSTLAQSSEGESKVDEQKVLYPLCKRPDRGGIKGTKTQFKVNYFPINMNLRKSFYQYYVEIKKIYTKNDNTSASFQVQNKQLKTKILSKVFAENNLDNYVFDGQHILYYLTDKLDNLKFTIQSSDDEPSTKPSSTFEIIFGTHKKLDLKAIGDYVNDKSDQIPSATLLTLINTLFRQNKLNSYFYLNQKLIKKMDKHFDLSIGACANMSYYQRVKLVQAGIMKNVDISCSMFYKQMNLIDFLLELNPSVNLNKRLSERELRNLNYYLRNINVTFEHFDNNYEKRINKVVSSANDIMFQMNRDGNSRELNVADYYEEINKPLNYPNMPCIQVKWGDSSTIHFPLELCKIKSDQPYFKSLNDYQRMKLENIAFINPMERYSQITNYVSEKEQNLNILKEYGVIANEKTMATVEARILEPTKFLYKDFASIETKQGSWKMMNNKFLSTVNLNNWIVLWMTTEKIVNVEAFDQNRAKFIDSLLKVFYKCGLNPVKLPVMPSVFSKTSAKQLFELIQANCPNPQLVILIIDDTDEVYADIKRNAEQQFGIITQCLLYKSIKKIEKKQYEFDAYLKIVALKINAKLGGINNTLKFDNVDQFKLNGDNGEPVMFMGADVSLNFDNELDARQSIAALVGSRDLNFSQYCVRMCEQNNKDKDRVGQEKILEMEEMSYLLIKTFEKNNEMLPTRIIYYRDGVNSSQLQSLLDFEVSAIKKACKRLNFDPKITMIVAQKRHHTRFFPLKDDEKFGKLGNIPPGSVIDTSIVSKNLFDFYLCSHFTYKGTIKPIRFIVTYDENNFSSDDIQYLTFDLCHSHSRAYRTTSLPAPLLYAHLAAYRARYFDCSLNKKYEDLENVGNLPSDKLVDVVATKLIEVHPNLEEKMFFV